MSNSLLYILIVYLPLSKDWCFCIASPQIILTSKEQVTQVLIMLPKKLYMAKGQFLVIRPTQFFLKFVL